MDEGGKSQAPGARGDAAAWPVRSASITRDGIEIPFEVAGHDGGPCLLFGHGLTASGLGTTTTFGPLLQAGWRVVVMDQRGHGTAGNPRGPDGFAVEAMGADLIAIADAVDPRPVHFGGGSMGAATAIAAAALAPHRTAGLALVGPAFGHAAPDGLTIFVEVAEAYATGSREAGETAWRQALGAVGADDATLDQQLAAQRHLDVDVLAWMLATIPRWKLGRHLDTVAELDLPAAVVAWDGDSIHPMSVAEEIATAWPRATLHRWDVARDGLDADAMARVLVTMLDAPAARRP
ncbi:MAG TPA: alpha/beta fold hydrolase [Ilumatobacter sp.]|nr:alpha/beta fold hydrolase [Ilumatobacter sp.]